MRFHVGDRVECRCTENEWKVGTVRQLFYAERRCPERKCAAYQVKLDNGNRPRRAHLCTARQGARVALHMLVSLAVVFRCVPLCHAG